MTGTIVKMNSKAGYIKADSGPVLYFRRASVLVPGFDLLDAGQPVTFDVDREDARIAVDVLRHFEWGPDNPPLEAGGSAPHLRYLGYEQVEGLRTFHFSAVPKGGKLVTFEIEASIELLTEHRIRIQDAPEICLRALESELTPEDWSAPVPRRHVLKPHHLAAEARR